MGNADDWAMGLATRIRAKQSATERKEQSVAMQRDIIAEKTPQMWEDLLSTLQSYSDAYNRHNDPERKLVCQRVGTHVFLIRYDAGPEIVTVNYDPSGQSIMMKGGSHTQWYLPKAVLIDEGSVELVDRSTGTVCRLGDIARRALEAGIGV